MGDVRLQVNDLGGSSILLGELLSVDSSTFTMEVKLTRDAGRIVSGIKINQSLSQGLGRAIFVPIAQQTYVILIKSTVDSTGFIHLGYYTPIAAESNTNTLTSAVTDFVYQRALSPGEFHVVSIAGTELYMPDSGDFYVKNNKGYFIKFSTFMDNLEVHVPDVCIHNYKVDVKSGRVSRISPNTNELQIKRRNIPADEASGISANREPFVEFTVDIGTMYDPQTSLPTGTRVGSLSLSDRVFDVAGNNPVAYEGASAFLQFLLQMASGIKISIDDNGDFHLVSTEDNSRFKFGVGGKGSKSSELVFKTESSELTIDANTFSFVNNLLGYFVKFNAESPTNSSLVVRIGDNTLVLDSEQGLQLSPASGGGITFSADGGTTINDKDGHIVMLNKDGIIINGDKTNVSVFGNVFNVLTTNGISIGNPAAAINGVLASIPTALAFDTHVHAGPGAPPSVPWSIPAMLQTLIAKGVKVG